MNYLEAKHILDEFYNNIPKMMGYCAASIQIDMSKMYDQFLPHIPEGGYILDAGCGAGRDTAEFLKRGYKVRAYDSSPFMAKYASGFTGQHVVNMAHIDLPAVRIYDGVWACASLVHSHDLKHELPALLGSVKPGGVVWISLKYGTGEFVDDMIRTFYLRDEKYFTDLLPWMCDYTNSVCQLEFFRDLIKDQEMNVLIHV